MSKTKRCHIVPTFYLKNFVPPSSKVLWIYDKKDKSCKPQQPINTTVIGNYYSQEIESFLTRIESETKDLIEKILANPDEKLTLKEKYKMSLFMATMHYRVPATISVVEAINNEAIKILLERMSEKAKNPQILVEEYSRFSKYMGESTPSFDEYVQLMKDPTANGKLKISPNDDFVKKMSFEQIFKTADIFVRMNWKHAIIHEDKFFITSDSPLNIFESFGNGTARLGAGFGDIRAQVSFPISLKFAFILDHLRPTKMVMHPPANLISEINKRTAHQAERFIISSFKSNGVNKLLNEASTTYGAPRIDLAQMHNLLLESFGKNI